MRAPRDALAEVSEGRDALPSLCAAFDRALCAQLLLQAARGLLQMLVAFVHHVAWQAELADSTGGRGGEQEEEAHHVSL